MDYAEQLLKGVDYVIAARLQEHKFDETIICTVVDDTKASEGLYVVSDGTIKFDAYSESVDYKVDQAVRVNIPKGDYSQKKYIVGKAVSEKNGNQPIVYGAPSAQILDLTDNVFSKGSGRSWSIYANGEQREKLIQSINLRDQYGGLIYDTLYLKANFKTIFNQYAMCSGGYGIYITATMASKDSSGKQNQRIYYFDSKHMFGNPYNYLISSSQETKFFIGKDESITNIAIYLYQDDSFKYKDNRGNIQPYPKSSLAEDIIVSDIYISLGTDLTQVEDNKVEIQTTESLNYNDPKTDVDNTKIIRLQWYNKDENNNYIGFSDGVVPHFEDRKFLFIGDSYGVGINSESWQGWPYYAAMNMDFTRPSSGGVYPPKSGATRYVNADPDWSQWIAIAQSSVGFAATSRHNPKTEISGNEDNSNHGYNFAELVSKANSILHTAKGNKTEANVLPSLPAGVSQYSEVLDDVTDIVVAADGWSDMWYDKEGSDPPDNEDDSDPEDIALGIINLIRNAKARCSQKLKRIYIFGIGSCDDNYKIKNEQGEDISNTDYARNILNQTYSQYANIISKLNNCEPINIQKNDDGTYVTKTFTRRESGVLQILQNATSNNDYYDCPQIVFYDIHDILNSNDFNNDKSDELPTREEDDGKHPAKSGYEKIGREIAKRTCLVESEMQYAKRLNEHNRIVRQMEKDGVPDDYAGFELSARYEEIKVLQKTLIKLINEDLFREIKYFRNAFNGVAKAEFEKWLSDLTGSNNSGLINNIIEEFNNLVKFYEDGLSFAKAAQDGLLSYSDSSGYLKEDGQIVVKPSGLRAIENQLLGRISQDDGGTVPSGYFTELIDGIGTSMDSIKKKITPETVNLGSIYDGYKVRIDKIKDTVIKNIATLKALICGNLYSIDVDLDNTTGNDATVNYYTSWYLFEDPAHKNDENGLGLLTHRIRHVQGSGGEPEKVNFIKTTYDPNKFDTKPNHYAISWYYYRDGYRAQEGEDNLGGNDWCAIEDPGIVNGKPRFTVFNTNDNIGLPTAERNEMTNKLEYPKKPRIDDPNSYLSISFSKERPDIKQEKIKAILTYNHEKYESNIITFENKDPAAGPELTNGIQIVHGSNSQAVYPLYGVDNTLIRASDENTKRQLKVQYLNERGEPESGNETVLKGASIYWYVPTYATMLRTEDVDLESTSGDQENFVKSSKTDLNFTVTKETVTETEKPYVNSCKLEYTIERPIFKQGNKDVYLFKGEIWLAKDEEDHLTDGGVVVKNNDKTKVSITYTYTYNRNDQYKKFYINNSNNIILLTNGGVTYSISEDGNYIIASDNTRYFINSSNKVTLPVNTIDDSDQSGYDCYYKRIEDVNDLTFTYRIKDYYSASFKNNTIKCKIIKGNQQLEGSISMDFNSHGSNGTNYSLIIKPVTWDVVWEQSSGDPDKKLLKNTYSFEIMLFDYENKQIPFNGTPEISLRSVKNEYSIGVSSSPSASNEAGILSYLTNNIEIFHTSYAPQILQVTAKQPWPLDSDNLVTLEAYYPIPFKRESGLLADIPTTIVYDSFGSNPSYYKNALCLYDNDGNLKTDAAWSIQYYSENGDITNSIPNRIKSFLPQIKGNSQNGSAMLLPSNMYVSNCDDIQVVLRCAYATDPDQTWWLQPILLYQNRYPSAMLNNWDGELSIDEDNNRILANIVGAGKKESDNSFSGVLMGEVENADVPTNATRDVLWHPHTGLGLYGFHHGEQSFGFNVNGTAFIGKSGSGRIAFDGTHGFIYSGNWLYEKNGELRDQLFNDKYELLPGSQGMAIDLQNGHIDAYDFKLTSANIELNSNPTQNGGDNYLYIGNPDKDLSKPYIKYTKNGDLDIKVNSFAITGTIGGANLLNNTSPREQFPLSPESPDSPRLASQAIPRLTHWTLANHSESKEVLKIGEWQDKRWILLGGYKESDNKYHRQMWNLMGSGPNFEKGLYTLSGFVYCHQRRDITFRLGSYKEGEGVAQTLEIKASTLTPIHLTFDLSNRNDIEKTFHIYESFNNNDFSMDGDGNKLISSTWYQGLKLEKGNYATAWSKSEQDIADDRINRKNLLFNTGPIEAEMLKVNTNEETDIRHWRLFNPTVNKLKVRRTSDDRRWLLLSGNEDVPKDNPTIHRRQVWQALDGTIKKPIEAYESYFSPGFYTLSGVAMCAAPRTITFGLGYYGDQERPLTVQMELLANQEKEFAYTFYVENQNSIKSIFHIYDTSDGETGDNAYSSSTHFHHLKLEEGLWATPWDPDAEDDGLTKYLKQKKIFNSLTDNGNVMGIWMDDYDEDGATDLYINATCINSGQLRVAGPNDTGCIFDASLDGKYVNIAGWKADAAIQGQRPTDVNTIPDDGRVFLFIGDSYGVGIGSGLGYGWPAILAETKLKLSDKYHLNGYTFYDSNPELSSRYVSAGIKNDATDGVSVKWFALCQGGTGFAAGTPGMGSNPSTASTETDSSVYPYYNFSSFVDMAPDGRRTSIQEILQNKLNDENNDPQKKNQAFREAIGADNLANIKWFENQLKNVTDIVVGGGWNDMWYRGQTDLQQRPREGLETDKNWPQESPATSSENGAIATGIRTFLDRAKKSFPSVKRISILGMGSCDSQYEGENVTNAWAHVVLDDIYASYSNAINSIAPGGKYEGQNNNTIDVKFYDIHRFANSDKDFSENDHFHASADGLNKIVNNIITYLYKPDFSFSRLVNNPIADQGFYLSNIKSDYWAIQIGDRNADFSSAGGGTYLQRPFMVSQDGVLWARNAHINGVITADALTANNYGVIAGWSFQDSKMTKTSVIETDDNGKAIEYYWTVIKAPTEPSATGDGEEASSVIDQTFLAVQHVVNEVDEVGGNRYVKVDDKGSAIQEINEWPFYVRHGGKLVANNAIIGGGEIGGIEISSGGLSGTGWSLSSTNSTIGGWKIGQTSLTNGTAGSDDSICLYTSDQGPGQYWRLLIGSKFKVDKNGNITANGGNIGSWEVTTIAGSKFAGLYSNQWTDSGGYEIYLTPKGISYYGYASAGTGNPSWRSATWGNIVDSVTTTMGVW